MRPPEDGGPGFRADEVGLLDGPAAPDMEMISRYLRDEQGGAVVLATDAPPPRRNGDGRARTEVEVEERTVDDCLVQQ